MIKCMEPIPLSYVKNDQEFIHQIKWDGIRGIAVIEDTALHLYTKNGIECTAKYPELKTLPENVDAGQAVLDGEIVVFMNGKPSFYHVLRRSLLKKSASGMQYPARYIVFDLLYLNRRDIRPLPLKERQEMLQSCFSGSAVSAPADSFEDGGTLFSLMKQKGMEGIVSKRLLSPYIAGKRHGDWFKTKVERKLLCAVTGVSYKNGLPTSLSLGVYRDGVLKPIGHVGSGVKQEDLKLLSQQIKPGDAPAVTCWVKFFEWTPAGTLRAPVMLGFSASVPEEATGEEQSL